VIPEFATIQGKLQYLAISCVGVMLIWRIMRVYKDNPKNTDGSATETRTKDLLHEIGFAGIVTAVIILGPSLAAMVSRIFTNNAV